MLRQEGDWQILYSDAAEMQASFEHRKVIGVTDVYGNLLASRALPTPRLPINIAEMEGVLLAIEHMQSPHGVLLTDSLDATKWLSGNGRKVALAKHLEKLNDLRERAKETWPRGWVIAWVPGAENRAHDAVVAKAREIMGETR